MPRVAFIPYVAHAPSLDDRFWFHATPAPCSVAETTLAAPELSNSRCDVVINSRSPASRRALLQALFLLGSRIPEPTLGNGSGRSWGRREAISNRCSIG
jgi:hypothetical protein